MFLKLQNAWLNFFGDFVLSYVFNLEPRIHRLEALNREATGAGSISVPSTEEGRALVASGPGPGSQKNTVCSGTAP